MSGAAGLDVRLPIGGLFAVLGLMLAAHGFFSSGDSAPGSPVHPAMTLNINLWWGLVMLVFGVLMLLGAALTHRKLAARTADQTVEGRRTEEREQKLGLER